MNRIHLLLTALCLTTFLYAQDNYQPGYIITQQQDTIRGFINLRTNKINQDRCDFKIDGQQSLQTYLPGTISGYRFVNEGKYYVSHAIELEGTTKTVFLEFLVKGLMNLYYYEDNTPYYFFENQAGNIEAISRKDSWVEDAKAHEDYRYIGAIRYIFQDYKPIVNKAENLKFNQKSMIGVVKEYHNAVCTTGEECIVFQNQHPDDKGLRVSFSVYAGLQQSQYRFNNVTPQNASDGRIYQTESNLSPVIGGQVTFMNPRWSQSFGVQVDASVSQFTGDIPFANTWTRKDYNALSASIRLGLKFIYPPKIAFRPTAEAGFGYTQLFSLHDETRRLPDGGHTGRELRKSHIGYYLALGGAYKLKNEHSIFLRLGYENYPLEDNSIQLGRETIRMFHAIGGYTF